MMSGILPSASNHPVWSPIAGEIHAVIWDRVGLKTVQGFVKEWASKWLKKFNSAESSQQESLARVRQQLHYPDYETLPLIADNLPYDRQMQQAIDAIKDWQPWLPELPLPPSPHRRRSPAEKWASLAALHDVYDSTGDTVLPWPLPEDDLDLVAFTEWFRGEAGAYQLLMRKAFELPTDRMSAIRRWLTDVSKDTLPKESKSNDLSQRLERIEAMVATTTNVGGTSKRSPNETTHEQNVERILNRDDEDVELPFGYVPNVLPKVVESAKDSEESSNAIEVPQGQSLQEILTAGLTDSEMNMLAKLFELERQFGEQPNRKSNPLWQKRYQANRYQKQRAAIGKRDLAQIARQILEAEKDRMQNLNVQRVGMVVQPKKFS